jgi:hypothetical protein
MPFKLRAPFETGVTSTGHRIERGICVVDTAEQAAYMAGPPFYFQILGEADAEAGAQQADRPVAESDEQPGEEKEIAKPAPRRKK